MARKYRKEGSSSHTILLVDDDAAYRDSMSRLLEREGHAVLVAADGPSALEILARRPVDLVLLDHFMPGMTGTQVCERLRTFDTRVQVVLQTGYASEHPPREMLRCLDIQGYCDKSEGPEKLLLWTDVALKQARALQALDRSRQGLRYILQVTPEMHEVRPLRDLLRGLLVQVSGLLGTMDAFMAVREAAAPSPDRSDALVAVVGSSMPIASCGDGSLWIEAGTGRFAPNDHGGPHLEDDVQDALRLAMTGGPARVTATATLLPLAAAEEVEGVLCVGRPVREDEDLDLLRVFANQAAVAIRNMRLYEIAAFDGLTGLHTRRFGEGWLRREVRDAGRHTRPISLLLLDLDEFKAVNDTWGHLVGDRVLAEVGRLLRLLPRGRDLACRLGGDEFALVLPETDLAGARALAGRIVEQFGRVQIPVPGGLVRPRTSIGAGMLGAEDLASLRGPPAVTDARVSEMADLLVKRADDSLYEAKRDRGGEPPAEAPVLRLAN